MNLQDLHKQNGALLASDGIPLHYGDALAEYNAALNTAVLLDRSHEGRIILRGKDRYELLNRMSTNKMTAMEAHEGRPTIFTNANARVIDRIIVYNRPDHLLVITEPGQGAAMSNFLQRHIFFNDEVQLKNITDQTYQFALHGPQADAIITALDPQASTISQFHSAELTIADATIVVARRKAISGSHYAFVVPREAGAIVYEAVQHAGKASGLLPAGGLTYNTLRIRAGHLARTELNTDYIPLELGLWDEVHFEKGCYTGQEIIARMESRARLAKTIVALKLSAMVPAPADIFHEKRKVGRMTSSVEAPTGERFALAVVKTDFVASGTALTIGENAVTATVEALVGQQPDFITEG